MKKLNECRMFLHAVTLSDIVSADGEEITIYAWNGTQEDRGVSQYQWPQTQKSLPNEHWEQWRSAIGKLFLLRHTGRTLKERLLLEWNEDEGEPKTWKWYICKAVPMHGDPRLTRVRARRMYVTVPIRRMPVVVIDADQSATIIRSPTMV